MTEQLGLWGLFLSSFISATLFPGGSEVVLAALAQQENTSRLTLLIIATVGNTLGGLTSYGIGWFIAKRFGDKLLTKPHQQRAVAWLHRWGSPALLLSWLPVVGDPLCVAAGWLRINFVLATLFIAAGKAARYVVVLMAV
jgi:membrane protein YqaA with SNARE-associated domain